MRIYTTHHECVCNHECALCCGCHRSDGAVVLWDVDMASSAPAGTAEAKIESGSWRYLKTFRTRRTAVCAVRFTHRNLLQTAGGTIPAVP